MTTLDAVLDRSVLLRRVLMVDAATCLAMGTLLVLFASPLAALLGLPSVLLAYAGAILFPIAGFMAWVGIRRELSRWGAWVVILGYVFVIAQAVVVGLLAELEYMGLRRI